MSSMTHLSPDRTRQGDFFIADICEASPKDDLASMEHPLFELRADDHRVRVYEHNGITVTVLPGATGCATIHDKDLWIYCISQLVEAKNRGRVITSTVRFIVRPGITVYCRISSALVPCTVRQQLFEGVD